MIMTTMMMMMMMVIIIIMLVVMMLMTMMTMMRMMMSEQFTRRQTLAEPARESTATQVQPPSSCGHVLHCRAYSFAVRSCK